MKHMKKDHCTIDLIKEGGTQASKNIRHLAVNVPYFERSQLIGDLVLVYSGAMGRSIIFCQSKKEANELAINAPFRQDVAVLHGDIPQA
jgi:ATP-dependent RNA helicase DDX21